MYAISDDQWPVKIITKSGQVYECGVGDVSQIEERADNGLVDIWAYINGKNGEEFIKHQINPEYIESVGFESAEQ